MADTSRSTRSPRRARPTATYRLQLNGEFDFGDAAKAVPYLTWLGVSHLYLSPILQATPGSSHGYDVLDHAAVSAELGGASGLRHLSAACRDHGLALIVDVVPNHMTVPPQLRLNTPLWSVLAEGPGSAFAEWFDIDWAAQDDRLVMPVLPCSVDELIAAGDLRVAAEDGPSGSEWVLQAGAVTLPVRAGTEALPLPELVAAQHYRLTGPEEAQTSVNFRRFFDINTLIALRVEVPRVFHATHDLLLSLARDGVVDGFRIDHPDGLADPADYLERLADGTGDAWVLVEKILAPGEHLPPAWHTAGTTGYDALLRIQQVMTDPDQLPVLAALWAERAPDLASLESVEHGAKLVVLTDVLAAELARLTRLTGRILPDADPDAVRRALTALLVAMSRYRAYVRPGSTADPEQQAVIDSAKQRATAELDPGDHATVGLLAELASGHRPAETARVSDALTSEFVIRFQQTCVSVLAKAVEDTAFYRWLPLAGANEVGGDPGQLTMPAGDFHAWCADRLALSPLAMTAATTHDTKRSEDVRARSQAIAEDALGWASWVGAAERLADHVRPALLDRPTEYLAWQTLATAWPLTAERLQGYLRKAIKEAKVHTSWHQPNQPYEQAVADFAAALITNPAIAAHVEGWLAGHAGEIRAAVLGLKLLALTVPGVPDLYQGSELQLLTLVDPDNRGRIDWDGLGERQRLLDSGVVPADLNAEKFTLCHQALRLRREQPEWFVGEQATYMALPTGSPHALAFGRGDDSGVQAVTVVTLAAGRLAEAGWGEATLDLPPGRWHDLLTGRHLEVTGPGVRLSEVLDSWPVALLRLVSE
ncbi:MAG: malto-oligosyltrehalose synthase [Micropruina sp.]